MRFVVAEVALVAMHGSSVHTYFVGLFFLQIRFDVGKHLMSHTLDAARSFSFRKFERRLKPVATLAKYHGLRYEMEFYSPAQESVDSLCGSLLWHVSLH